MQPLIQEVKDPWQNDIDTYNSFSRQVFKLHVALIWTISDYPRLGNFSGWNIHTGHAM